MTKTYSDFDLCHGWHILLMAAQREPVARIAFMHNATPDAIEDYIAAFPTVADRQALFSAAQEAHPALTEFTAASDFASAPPLATIS